MAGHPGGGNQEVELSEDLMTRCIVRRKLVHEDLIDHFVYIGQDNMDAADRFLEHVEIAFQRLRDLPFLGMSRTDDFPSFPDLRVWPVPGFENYLIFLPSHGGWN